MHMMKNQRNFDTRSIEQMLAIEDKFVTDVFSILCLPIRHAGDDEEENEDNGHSDNFKKKDKTRAKSLSELQERLQAITGKKKLTYKEKITKKNLKNKMKKKNKQDERNAQQKLLRAQKAVKVDVKTETDNVSGLVRTAKPVFNSEGKMVFSKFDFTNLGVVKDKKQEKNPKKILKNLEKEKEKIQELEASGDVGKVIEITEKTAWKNALAKAQGEKVKDDPSLLKKTVQRHEHKKRSSSKKWSARQENVLKMQQERQNKRNENIEKRKKEKKKKQKTKAVKRGKIIPGY